MFYYCNVLWKFQPSRNIEFDIAYRSTSRNTIALNVFIDIKLSVH